MSLFVCSNCGTAENTALCGFWFRPDQSVGLCSECDPAIGKWHGIFPRRQFDGSQTVAWKDGVWVERKEVH